MDADEWLELTTSAEAEAVESVSAVFAEFGQGVAIEQVVESSRDGDVVTLPADAPVLIKTYLPVRDPTTAQRRTRIEKGVWALGRLRQVGPLQVRTLREADWANAWKEYFFVHRVGQRTVIVPSWRQAEYEARPDDVVLLLDPGMAFGTGLHPTTRMRVIDVGAGSGILSIAAAKLGAAHVAAVEIEPVAASVCQDNVQRNVVGDIVSVRAGTLDGPPDVAYDLVLANITIATLLQLNPLLWQQLRPGGVAVLSGVLDERADELVRVFEAAGWQHERTDLEQDWVAVLMRRP